MAYLKREDLKVGMVVSGEAGECSRCWKLDGEYVPFRITEILGRAVYNKTLNGDCSDNISCAYCGCADLNRLTLVEPFETSTWTGGTIRYVNDQSFIQKIMNNIIQTFRNLTLSADDKMLVEMGLENPQGVPTSEGIQLMSEVLYKANRAALIEAAKQIKAEQDTQKK